MDFIVYSKYFLIDIHLQDAIKDAIKACIELTLPTEHISYTSNNKFSTIHSSPTTMPLLELSFFLEGPLPHLNVKTAKTYSSKDGQLRA